MDVHEVRWEQLGIGRRDVLLELGYGDREADPPTARQIDALLAGLSPEGASRFVCRIYPGEAGGGEVRIAGRVLQVGPVIASLMNGATAFAVFAATAGDRFEQQMQATEAEKNILENYLTGAIGTCLVEKTGDYLEAYLRTEYAPLPHTRRVSPGYCGWPLTDQRELFRLLGGRPCGIELSACCLMTPIKSISGIIGIGERVRRRAYGCAWCDRIACYKRKKNQP